MAIMPETMNPDPESDPGLAHDVHPGRSDAPTLVYCHGLLSSRNGIRAEMLRRWCKGKGWPLLTFDFQGRGDSPGSLEDITLSRQLEDLDAVLKVLPAGVRPVLFGSSFGGITAAWYAALHPDRIPACILVAPALGFVSNLLKDAGLERAREWRQTGRRVFEGDRAGLTVNHGLVEDSADYPEALLMASYRTPTLLAHGMKDDTVPCRRSVEFMEGVRPGLVDLHLFAGGDHRIHAYMEDVLMLAETFLKRLGMNS